jgi:RimJ/RimL family protein N-acetyltransferase
MNGKKSKKEVTMNQNLFTGELIHLTAEDPQVMAENFARWSTDTEYRRLEDSGITFPWSVKQVKEWMEKDLLNESGRHFSFTIRTLEGDKIIGEIGLGVPSWNHADAWVGIGLGEREDWGKGYGTDAMRVILRYGFTELNLRRVSLDVFEYNPRAIRSYEKAGFVHEGQARKFLNRDGKRWDLIYMGILREEWELKYGAELHQREVSPDG